jgi:hypothetical protein
MYVEVGNSGAMEIFTVFARASTAFWMASLIGTFFFLYWRSMTEMRF